MCINRHWIVSNFNQNPAAVIADLDGSFEIFNQGETDAVPENLRKDGLFRQSLHSGHNLSDYLQFIVENYENLPDEVGFAKGNLFPRHISRDVFLKRKRQKGFVPLYSDTKTFAPNYGRITKVRFISQQISPGLYIEINNGWYLNKRSQGRYYNRLDDMFLGLFKRPGPKYNPFVPGACMIVPKENILRWPRSLFQHLHEVTTYTHFPVEAFHLERAMFHLFGAQKE